MKTEKYHLYLTDSEFSFLLRSVVHLKNEILYQSRHTDAVDDILYKLGNIKPKKFKIKYI